MKGIILVAIGLILGLSNLNARAAEDSKYNINPTKDKSFSAGIYIPSDINDCFKELEKMLSPEFIKEIKTGAEADMGKYHRGLGMWIRNNWGLWKESRLKKYFNDLGVHHPDDMSGIILTSFWRSLNNKPIQLKEQIKYYQDYWKNVKNQKQN